MPEDPDIHKLIEPFTNGQFDLANESSWAQVTDQQVHPHSRTFKINFWTALAELFLQQETTLGHLHKGHIYWRLGIEYLVAGDFERSLTNLDKSVEEDVMRAPGFTAAKGITQILKPLHDHPHALEIYQGMTPDEKEEFAKAILLTHDQLIAHQLTQIKDNFFTFIDDEVMRQIVHDTYNEVFLTVSRVRHDTFYSCVFAIGSIVEGMIDDLFAKNDNEIWKCFITHAQIQQDSESRDLLKPLPPEKFMLGPKLKVLYLMSKHGTSPISKTALLQMYVIHAYRNLIHPNRRKTFPFTANWYIAAAIFTFISHVASHWWPQNIQARLNGATLNGSQ